MPGMLTGPCAMHDFIQALKQGLEQFDTVVLFRHIHPDGDALGSQKGMAAWLKARYPEKTILMAGEGMDAIDDKTIENALAIVTDTSNAARVDDTRFEKAARKLAIDHHVKVETLGDANLVDEKAAAACELAALLLQEMNETIPPQAAQRFMEGLMTDTQRFTISTVRPQTFQAAAWLVSQGADAAQAARDMFSKSWKEARFEAFLLDHANRENRFAWSVCEQNDYLMAGLSFEQAKDHVNALGGMEDVQIWALFTRMKDGVHYSASLRSQKIPIREVAVRHGGGGHECAAGIKNLDAAAVSDIIETLSALSAK